MNKHIGYYLSLILILVGGSILAISTAYDRQLQTLIVVVTTLFYVGWGILHHLINHDLSSKIVIEYVLMGSFGLSVVLFILKGGIL